MYIRKVSHIGLTVTNLQRSIEFYRDILGLYYKGQMVMEGASSDELFQKKNIYAKVGYLSYSKENSPADIELIEFVGTPITKRNPSLFETSISELCFEVWDIEKFYEMLKAKNVKTMSSPQEFDSTKYGMGKSKALYFYDPDGNILEAITPID